MEYHYIRNLFLAFLPSIFLGQVKPINSPNWSGLNMVTIPDVGFVQKHKYNSQDKNVVYYNGCKHCKKQKQNVECAKISLSISWWWLTVKDTLQNIDEVTDCPCLIVAMFKRPGHFWGTIEGIYRLYQSIQSWRHQLVVFHKVEHRLQHEWIDLAVFDGFVHISIYLGILGRIKVLK